jgi:GGDEF domain-containing protein
MIHWDTQRATLSCKGVAERLKKWEEEDTIARLGGDEFLVMLTSPSVPGHTRSLSRKSAPKKDCLMVVALGSAVPDCEASATEDLSRSIWADWPSEKLRRSTMAVSAYKTAMYFAWELNLQKGKNIARRRIHPWGGKIRCEQTRVDKNF